MVNGYRRADLQALAQAKYDDSALLFTNRRFSNAYYLAGYAVELGLKACIARQILLETLPDPKFIRDVYGGHDISKLVGLAGLKSELKNKEDADSAFAASWSIAAEWRADSRYEHRDISTAELMLEAVGHRRTGVLPWIKNYW